MNNSDTIVAPSDLDKTQKWSTSRIPAPQKIRKGETREGGFIVIERTRKKRLLRPAAWPVEIADLATAVVAVRSLQERFPDREFSIFEQVGSFPPVEGGEGA